MPFRNFLELLTTSPTYTLFCVWWKKNWGVKWGHWNNCSLLSCCSLGDERKYVHTFFRIHTKMSHFRRKEISSRFSIVMMTSMRWFWEAKGRKKDEKLFHNACVENIFYIRTFSALEIFSAFHSLTMQRCITQKMIAVHNEHNDDDVNCWHVVCVCLYIFGGGDEGRKYLKRVSISKGAFLILRKYFILDFTVNEVLCINYRFFRVITRRRKGKLCLGSSREKTLSLYRKNVERNGKKATKTKYWKINFFWGFNFLYSL